MTIDEQLFEKIEAYIRKTMPEQERSLFETEMANNVVLKEEVELRATLMSGVEREGVKSTLEDIYNEKFGKEASKQRNIFQLPAFRIAAGVALLIVMGWLAMVYLQTDHSSLANAYFELPQGLPTLLSAQGDPQFEEGMVAYKLGEHEKAAGLWRPLLEGNPNNDTLTFYLAANHMAQEEHVQAAFMLTGLATNESTSYQMDALWYLALLELKMEKTETAMYWLDLLADYQNKYSDRAKDLLKKLQ
ncbi:MAG: hypothetical protein AAF502_00745 [Bacteroidota bacterium]